MVRNDLFRLVEKRLFRHKENIRQLNNLKDELSILRGNGDIKVQQYSFLAKYNGINDIVADYCDMLIALENKIKRLENNIAPVTRFLDDLEKEKTPLSRNLLLFVRLFYIDKHSIKEISNGLNIPRRTLYDRRRQIMKKCADYFRS